MIWRKRESPVFVSSPALRLRSITTRRPSGGRRVLTAVGIVVAGLAATTSGLAPVQTALVPAALVRLLAGLLALRETYEAID